MPGIAKLDAGGFQATVFAGPLAGAVKEKPEKGFGASFVVASAFFVSVSGTVSTCLRGLGCRARDALAGIKGDIPDGSAVLLDEDTSLLALLFSSGFCASAGAAVAAGKVKLLFSLPLDFDGSKTNAPADVGAGVLLLALALALASGLKD